MRQPKENARRSSGGLRDALVGVRRSHHIPTQPGWIFVLGDSDAFKPSRHDRSIRLAVRIECIEGEPQPVLGCSRTRCISEVKHRGEVVRVRVDGDAHELAHIIVSRRIGGGA